MYKLIIVPEGSVLPEDLAHLFTPHADIIEKIFAAKDKEIIVAVNVRELQMIVEYRDLFDLEVRAIIGLTGAMYNTVWSTYISTMKRLTVDNLRVEMREGNDVAARRGSDDIVQSSKAARTLRAVPPPPLMSPTDEESDFGADGAS